MPAAEEVPTWAVRDLPGEPVLLDVREDDEWQAGHAPRALHIPLRDLPARVGEVGEHPGTSDSTVYVVCRSGARSAQATVYLNALGYRAVNVAGGMQSWHAEGREMIASDPASRPEVR